MANHITIRMAWHDNEWSGKICDKPKQNVYCTGIHSLLSARLQRNKNPDMEDDHHGEKLNFDEDGNYFPPCYWSCNAFSSQSYNLEIEHPFENIKAEPVKDTLKPYSVYTWPFRLTFNHSREKFLREGKYPPDLEKRIKDFFGKFKPKETVIFFYANYDNPITADDEKSKYVLLGCSLLTGIDPAKYFDFADGEYEKIQKGKLFEKPSKKCVGYAAASRLSELGHPFAIQGLP